MRVRARVHMSVTSPLWAVSIFFFFKNLHDFLLKMFQDKKGDFFLSISVLIKNNTGKYEKFVH